MPAAPLYALDANVFMQAKDAHYRFSFCPAFWDFLVSAGGDLKLLSIDKIQGEIVEEILLTKGGWKSGSNAEWDKERALFPAQIFAFIQDTQPKLWGEMRTLLAEGLEHLLLTALVKELDTKGSLHVLRHGFKFYGKTFRLAYFKPAHGANYEVLERFDKNRLTVTRQVPCHPADNRTLDIVLAVNGLPVGTIELKNPGEPSNAVTRTAAEPELLRLHRHPQGQNAGVVRTARPERPARGVSPLLDAPGD